MNQLSVLFLMGSWKAPSELFLFRHLQMLKEAGALDSVVAAKLRGNTIWKKIPVFGLNPVFSGNGDGIWPDHQAQLDIFDSVIRKTKANTLLCQYGTIAVLLDQILDGIQQRLFIHVHGKDIFEHMHPPGYKEKLMRLFERSDVICNPFGYKRLVQWGVDPKRLFVKKYGVEVPDTPYCHTLSNEVTILHLGRLVDFKGPDRTIMAFELACEQGLQGRLIIAGDGPLREQCETLRKKSRWRDRILFVGFVSPKEAQRLYHQSDIFTQHSILGEQTGQVETFGVSLIEAMAAALPVVSCAIGGIPENIIDGETGILGKPGDIQAQANAFLKLAKSPNLRRFMGEAGWYHAKKNFTFEQERERLIDILKYS